jgi:uncharacterized protein HemX
MGADPPATGLVDQPPASTDASFRETTMNLLLKSLCGATLALAAALVMATEPTAWEKIKTFAHDSKKEAVAEGRKMIAATDKKIEEMKKETAKATGDAKKAHEANMKELQAKRKAAQAELDKMQKSAANTWDATKAGFSNAYKDLHTAYEKARAGGGSK